MITAKDVEFHTPANADYRYGETNYFCLYIPEERIMAQVYTLARKAIGVMYADVLMLGCLTESRGEYLYFDAQQHLPAPEKFSDYTTPNGLHIKATKPPRDYRVDYVGSDNTEIHVDFTALMEPFDIHDPDHSPKAQQDKAAQAAGSGLGEAYGGHFDLTGRVTGSLILRGKEYKVDCVETMDHSWGLRPENDLHPMGWMHAHFGPDLTIHWINTWDLDQPIDSQHALAHGYVLEHGQVYGLTDIKIRSTRMGSTNTAIEVEATDKRGRVFRMHGVAEVGAPWTCYTSAIVTVTVFRWVLSDGRIGYGMAQDNQPLKDVNLRRGRRWTATQPQVG